MFDEATHVKNLRRVRGRRVRGSYDAVLFVVYHRTPSHSIHEIKSTVVSLEYIYILYTYVEPTKRIEGFWMRN